MCIHVMDHGIFFLEQFFLIKLEMMRSLISNKFEIKKKKKGRYADKNLTNCHMSKT